MRGFEWISYYALLFSKDFSESRGSFGFKFLCETIKYCCAKEVRYIKRAWQPFSTGISLIKISRNWIVYDWLLLWCCQVWFQNYAGNMLHGVNAVWCDKDIMEHGILKTVKIMTSIWCNKIQYDLNVMQKETCFLVLMRCDVMLQGCLGRVMLREVKIVTLSFCVIFCVFCSKSI